MAFRREAHFHEARPLSYLTQMSGVRTSDKRDASVFSRLIFCPTASAAW